MSKSTLTRRALVASTAAIPAVALPAIPAVHAASELAIEQLGTELSAAIDDHSAVCDRVEIAEDAMWEWERRNPKPELNETYDADYIRAMDKVAADLRAAVQSKDKTQQDAHDAAVKAWTQRKEVAERECGYTAVHNAEGAVCNETKRLIDALAETPAGSLRALKMKAAFAALAVKTYDGTTLPYDLARSVIDDINRLVQS